MQVPIYIYSLILHQTRDFTRENRPCVRIRPVPNLEEELCVCVFFFVESPFFLSLFLHLFSRRTVFSAGTIDGRVHVCVCTSMWYGIWKNRKWTTAKTTDICRPVSFATIICTLRTRYKSVT